MGTLMLVDFKAPQQDKGPLSDKQKLEHIKAEVYSGLEDRLEEIRKEAEKVHSTMEQALFRVGKHGFDAKLDDLRTGKWYKLKTEIALLQEIASLIEGLE